ncbi:MAG TPA: acylphosphatase [Nocardioidaceae bacterium]|nr:acylphosphatase [Nocardioidaceae bacterium]
MSSDVIARRVVVHGLVQGVFFRDSCRRQAELSRVAGWVRNEPDGTVGALFEGPRDAVVAMVDWCRQGPPRARVERVEVAEAGPTGSQTFDVLG